MKTFSFVIPLILSILCLLYLLLYPCSSNTAEHDFSAKVLAKEKEHNTISNAFFLETGAVRKEKLEAHEKCYYYVSSQKNIAFSINSHNIQYIKASLFSDTGKQISCHMQRNKNSLLVTPKNTDNTKRIFLCLTNQTVYECTVQIQSSIITTAAQKPKKSTASNPRTTTPKPHKPTASNPKTATPKPHKPTASNPKTTTPKPHKPTASNPKTATPKPHKPTASNPKTATPKPHKSTASNPKTATPKPHKSTVSKPDKTLNTLFKKALLQPQFLLLQPNSSKKITITNYTQKNTAKQFIWLSTNPNIATVKNGIISTHQEGTTIIYLKDKKHAKNTSSCLIRVIGKENIIDG